MSAWFSPDHVATPEVSTHGERLWRVRKDHRTAEAQLRATRDLPGVEVQFFYNGEFVFGRRWPTRELALKQAEEKLQELLQRAWTTHW